MAVIDLVKWNGTADLLAWKYPSEELSTWTQLVVNESQEAFLVRGGVYEGPFGAGRHTLSTENLPILREVIGLPFGAKSPFSSEVWFVNKIINLDIKWGTPDPIQLQDPKFNIMVPVRAFGQFGIKIQDSKKFLLKLVGTASGFDPQTLAEYFNGIFITKIKTEIANSITSQGKSVLEMQGQLESVSAQLKAALSLEMQNYGVWLEQFNVISINLPEEDSAVKSLKAALAKKAEMQILGFDYQQERSFDVLQTAAGNEGAAGGVIGAGIGMGMGAGIGIPMGQAMAGMGANLQTTNRNQSVSQGESGMSKEADQGKMKASSLSMDDKLRVLKQLGELKSQGILSEEEFASEKKKILES